MNYSNDSHYLVGSFSTLAINYAAPAAQSWGIPLTRRRHPRRPTASTCSSCCPWLETCPDSSDSAIPPPFCFHFWSEPRRSTRALLPGPIPCVAQWAMLPLMRPRRENEISKWSGMATGIFCCNRPPIRHRHHRSKIRNHACHHRRPSRRSRGWNFRRVDRSCSDVNAELKHAAPSVDWLID